MVGRDWLTGHRHETVVHSFRSSSLSPLRSSVDALSDRIIDPREITDIIVLWSPIASSIQRIALPSTSMCVRGCRNSPGARQSWKPFRAEDQSDPSVPKLVKEHNTTLLSRVHAFVLFLAARAMTPVAVFTANAQDFRIRTSGIPGVDRQKYDDCGNTAIIIEESERQPNDDRRTSEDP